MKFVSLIQKNEPDNCFIGNFDSALNYAKKCREWLKFGEQVDYYLDKESYKDNRNWFYYFKFGTTTKLLQKIGLSKLSLCYGVQHLRMAVMKKDANKHQHGLTVQQIKRFPELLEKPVFISENPLGRRYGKSVLCCLCDTDSDNKPIILSITPDDKGYYTKESCNNLIHTIFGVDDWENYIDKKLNIEDILFVDYEQAERLERLSSTNILSNYSNLPDKSILHHANCFINRGLEQKTIKRVKEDPPKPPTQAGAEATAAAKLLGGDGPSGPRL